MEAIFRTLTISDITGEPNILLTKFDTFIELCTFDIHGNLHIYKSGINTVFSIENNTVICFPTIIVNLESLFEIEITDMKKCVNVLKILFDHYFKINSYLILLPNS